MGFLNVIFMLDLLHDAGSRLSVQETFLHNRAHITKSICRNGLDQRYIFIHPSVESSLKELAHVVIFHDIDSECLIDCLLPLPDRQLPCHVRQGFQLPPQPIPLRLFRESFLYLIKDFFKQCHDIIDTVSAICATLLHDPLFQRWDLIFDRFFQQAHVLSGYAAILTLYAGREYRRIFGYQNVVSVKLLTANLLYGLFL